MTHAGYRTIDHTADLGIEVWAPTLEGLYATAARALCELMGAPDSAGDTVRFTLESEGVDPEDLLVRLLSDVLAALELEGRYIDQVTQASVARRGDDWVAHLECRGPRIDRDVERGLTEIKAVTYHGLALEAHDEGFRARVLFDL